APAAARRPGAEPLPWAAVGLGPASAADRLWGLAWGRRAGRRPRASRGSARRGSRAAGPATPADGGPNPSGRSRPGPRPVGRPGPRPDPRRAARDPAAGQPIGGAGAAPRAPVIDVSGDTPPPPEGTGGEATGPGAVSATMAGSGTESGRGHSETASGGRAAA